MNYSFTNVNSLYKLINTEIANKMGGFLRRPACSHCPLWVFCFVPLVVGEEFCECDWLVVVYLDRCVQNAVVRLEVRPPCLFRF